MAKLGIAKCLWEALPQSKLSALSMPKEQYEDSDGSMINVVGDDAYFQAFERCNVDDEGADWAGQALNCYVVQLRAERALEPWFRAEALDRGYSLLPEADLRRAADHLNQDINAVVEARRGLESSFLAHLPSEPRPELTEYLEARLSVFGWEVLLPEALQAQMATFH